MIRFLLGLIIGIALVFSATSKGLDSWVERGYAVINDQIYLLIESDLEVIEK